MAKAVREVNERQEYAETRDRKITGLAWFTYAIALFTFFAVATYTALHFISMIW